MTRLKGLIKRIYSGFEFEINYKLYKKIGVLKVKKYIPTFGDYWINLYNKKAKKRIKIVGSRKDCMIWIYFTLCVEALHFLAFVLMSYFIIKSFLENRNYFLILGLVILNVLVNVYPVLIQRYNRLRIINLHKIDFKELMEFKVD